MLNGAVELIIPALLITAGALIGYRLPDIDLAPVLPVRHRSAWTHGPVIPAALVWAANAWPEWRHVCIGLQCGVFVHQLRDLFPRAWRGSALINWFPLAWTFGPLRSALWLIAGLAVPVGYYLL